MLTSFRTAIVVVVVSFSIHFFFFAGEDSCGAKDLPVPLSLSIDSLDDSVPDSAINPCQVFSETYVEARTRFREAVEALQGLEGPDSHVKLDTLPVIGEEYTMDIATIPGSAPGVVFHLSGVHGVEGFAGSAIQIAFLKLLYVRLSSKEKDTFKFPTVIVVHAVNPYGMALYRRWNENNVDLNRNGLLPDDWKTFAVDHYNRETYDHFDKTLFNPSEAPTWWSATGGFLSKAARGLAKYGLPKMKAAMVSSQYHKPSGIFYGGHNQVEPSLRILKGWLEEYLSKRKTQQGGDESDLSPLQDDAVTWIDLHTGLGPKGVDTILMTAQKLAGGEEKTVQELEKWFPGCRHPFQGDRTSESVAQGYEQVKGTTEYIFGPLFSPTQNALLLTQEFGTSPAILVGRALVLENAAYHHLPADEALEWAKQTTGPAFYPQSRTWRKQILERGVRMMAQAMNRSKQLSEA